MAGDTVVALSSPPGPALRAVVRLSGPDAIRIAGGLPGAVVFRAPRSYTREDVVELHLPGAAPLVEATLRELAARGARPALPGEFTLRAFLNGRLDLVQAEAVGRLVAAESQRERRAALDQLSGGLSRPLGAVESDLLDLAADVEAAIDFADQDIEVVPVERALARASALRERLAALRARTASRRVGDGRPVVALYGRPGAGKSSLFNALAGADALVGAGGGTTRDVLMADAVLGMPVRLLDAPGQGPAGGLEGRAAGRGAQAAEGADLVLFVVDVTDWEPSVPLEPRGRPALLVLNKCDLAAPGPVRARFGLREAVAVSARTGEGLEALRAKGGALLGGEEGEGGEARFLLDARQARMLAEAEAALGRAAGTGAELGLECVALDLRAALEALGAVTGRHVGEDLLDRIFSRFCLGK